MPTEITINSLTGSNPYDIYLCDDPISTCVYIDTISSTPYTFSVPNPLDENYSYNIKVVDNNGCIIYQNLSL